MVIRWRRRRVSTCHTLGISETEVAAIRDAAATATAHITAGQRHTIIEALATKDPILFRPGQREFLLEALGRDPDSEAS